MEIREREDELFEEWKKRHPASFVVDGAPCPSRFLTSQVKTVIILKDVNAPDAQGGLDLRNELATDPNPWWRTIANWCAAMSEYSEAPRWSELDNRDVKKSLEPFAFMQLKKTAGGGSVSEDTLIDFARKDADKIREQLTIYRPNVIVAGGVGQILASVLKGTTWHQTARGVWYADLNLSEHLPTTYLIDYMHPSARAMKSVVCFGLVDAYREIIDIHRLF